MIATWQQRCETHPDHQKGMVTNQMIMDRMQEEIDELRATIKENLKVDPVGYFSINSYGNWEQNESGYGTPFYEAPPKREPMTEQQLDDMFDKAEIAIYLADRQQKEHLEVYSFGVRDAEKWHGIGGEE